ncbi:alpha/beta hydrolase [Rhodococcoides fascians]|uniref:alpha/beta hydrolase n=1 Tax=Rhodococcoides fascians TaxID=1828 RepID=UPI003525C277
MYLHGGGWIGGTIHSDILDIQARERCAGADCVVVLAEYRKAPEHQYPTGLNDSYAALEWIAAHADDIDVRRDVITIGGGSAGANLAAAVTLKARDECGPAIAMQLLEAPALDLTLRSPSMERFGTGYGLTAETVEKLLDYYLSSRDLSTHPYVSPLLAPDLSNLPPAHIMSSEYDPIRDDGERYAERLAEAGVSATFTEQEGHIHISSAFTKVMASAREWRSEVIGVLRSVHEAALDRQAS